MDTLGIDEALDQVITRRAASATAGDLIEDVRAVVGRTEQRPATRGWFRSARLPRVVGLTGLAAAALAVVVGISILAGQPRLPGVGSGPSPTSRFPQLACDPRPVPTGSGPIDLTGSWTDVANLYFLRRVGDTIWGVAFNSADATSTIAGGQGPYLILHGTVSGESTVQVDWVSAGQRYPGEQRFGASFDGAVGTMTWQIGVSNDGNVQLTTTNETGTPLSGPAYQLPTLKPCTPGVR